MGVALLGIRGFIAEWQVFDLTGAMVVEAIQATRRFSISCWDALIWATARQNGVQTMLTEDQQDGMALDGVRFVNPFAADFDLASLR